MFHDALTEIITRFRCMGATKFQNEENMMSAHSIEFIRYNLKMVTVDNSRSARMGGLQIGTRRPFQAQAPMRKAEALEPAMRNFDFLSLARYECGRAVHGRTAGAIEPSGAEPKPGYGTCLGRRLRRLWLQRKLKGPFRRRAVCSRTLELRGGLAGCRLRIRGGGPGRIHKNLNSNRLWPYQTPEKSPPISKETKKHIPIKINNRAAGATNLRLQRLQR